MLLALVGLMRAVFAQTAGGELSAEQRRAIPLVISSDTTSSGFFTRGPVIDKLIFILGEPVHIGIVMTNTARKSVWVCAFSNPYYQNRPQLMRDGEAVGYSEKIRELIRPSDDGTLCEFTRTPDFVDLKPNVPLRVPSLELQEWYGPLNPGHYTLFIKRTFACCADGKWNATNAISFDITR
jgi:hypothetical protein